MNMNIFGKAQVQEPRVCIVGCGIAGICAAVRLQRDLGLRNFLMFDLNSGVGGTWFTNTYPGCSCDGPIHLYSYSFEPKSDWKCKYATQPEILEYLNQICVKHGLLDRIKFRHLVKKIQFQTEHKYWKVQFVNLENGEWLEEIFDIVILGTGILRNPKIPDEFKAFKGPLFHSARWDHRATLEGLTVGVVGVGASGVQLIPEISKVAGKVIVYQRRAPWILPKENKMYLASTKRTFKFFPHVQQKYREALRDYMDRDWVSLISGSVASEKMAAAANSFRDRELHDFPMLNQQLTPKDTIGCQRVLLSSDFYETMKRSNIELVTFKTLHTKEDSLVVESEDGIFERKVDVIVLATGFQTEKYFFPIEIFDVNGHNLLKQWEDMGPSLLYGITANNLPNLFFLWGPNTARIIFFPQIHYHRNAEVSVIFLDY